MDRADELEALAREADDVRAGEYGDSAALKLAEIVAAALRALAAERGK